MARPLQLRHMPGHWVICGECLGSGGTSAHLGSFTASDWADEDPDFRDDCQPPHGAQAWLDTCKVGDTWASADGSIQIKRES
jgi:hypothetical protein